MRQVERVDWRVVAVLLVFLFLYLVAGSINFEYPDFQDHSKAAERIASGGVLYRDHIQYINVYHYPPVFLYFLGGVYYLLGVDFLAGRAVLAVFNILSGILLYLLASQFLKKYALITLFLFLANPVTFSTVYVGYFDNFVVFFMLLSLYMLQAKREFLSGLALGIGFMSKPFALLLLPVLIPFCLQRCQRLECLLGFTTSTAVISAPFLYLAPGEFLHYAFLYNFERSTESLSLYFYYLPWLKDSLLPVALQLGFVGWTVHGILSTRHRSTAFLHTSILFLATGFLTLNRINYPHYLIYLTPFLSLILTWEYEKKRPLYHLHTWQHLLASTLLMLTGARIWAMPWDNGVYDFKSSGLFWTGSTIYFIASLYLMLTLYHIFQQHRHREPAHKTPPPGERVAVKKFGVGGMFVIY